MTFGVSAGLGVAPHLSDTFSLHRAGFNWKSQRDFVELLMRDREDSLLEHKKAREAALRELDQKAEKNRRLIHENKALISSGASGLSE